MGVIVGTAILCLTRTKRGCAPHTANGVLFLLQTLGRNHQGAHVDCFVFCFFGKILNYLVSLLARGRSAFLVFSPSRQSVECSPVRSEETACRFRSVFPSHVPLRTSWRTPGRSSACVCGSLCAPGPPSPPRVPLLVVRSMAGVCWVHVGLGVGSAAAPSAPEWRGGRLALQTGLMLECPVVVRSLRRPPALHPSPAGVGRTGFGPFTLPLVQERMCRESPAPLLGPCTLPLVSPVCGRCREP